MERFTCADFQFTHPGTLASPQQTAALALIPARGPPAARQSLKDLTDWAVPDLDVPPMAAAVVFCAYNPSKWDVARMTPAMLTVSRARCRAKRHGADWKLPACVR